MSKKTRLPKQPCCCLHCVAEGVVRVVDFCHQGGAQPELIKFFSQLTGVAHRSQRTVFLTQPDTARDFLYDFLGAGRQHLSHAVVLIADFRAELDHQAFASRQVCALGRLPEGEVAQQPLSRRSGTAQLVVCLLQIVAEVVRQQRFCELFLGFEVVVKRAFGNTGNLDYLGKPDGTLALVSNNRPCHINDVLTRICRLFFHSATTLFKN